MLGLRERNGIRNRGAANLPGGTIVNGTLKATRLWATGAGTVSEPAVTVGSVGTSGWYERTSTALALSIVGTSKLDVASGGVTTQTGLFTTDISVGTGADISMGSGGQILLDPSTSLTLPPLAFVGDLNTGMGWTSDGVGRLIGNGGLASSFLTSSLQPVSMYASGPVTIDSYIALGEIAAPGAASTNQVRLYAVDAAGKTRLADIFNTGAQFTINQEV